MVSNGAPATQPGYQAPPQQHQQPSTQHEQQQQQPQPQEQQPQAHAAPTQVFEVPPVDLLFDTNSATLPSTVRSQLEAVATWAKCNPRGAVILEGHADVRGTPAYNMTLSTERAAAVRQKLILLGVPGSRIVVTVYGEYGPRRGSLQQDRRVTLRAVERPVPTDDITAQR